MLASFQQLLAFSQESKPRKKKLFLQTFRAQTLQQKLLEFIKQKVYLLAFSE